MANENDVLKEINIDGAGITEEQIRQIVMATLDARDKKRAQEQEEARKKRDIDPFTRMTFIIRKEYLTALREYAEAHRMTVKNALDQALKSFFEQQ